MMLTTSAQRKTIVAVDIRVAEVQSLVIIALLSLWWWCLLLMLVPVVDWLAR